MTAALHPDAEAMLSALAGARCVRAGRGIGTTLTLDFAEGGAAGGAPWHLWITEGWSVTGVDAPRGKLEALVGRELRGLSLHPVGWRVSFVDGAAVEVAAGPVAVVATDDLFGAVTYRLFAPTDEVLVVAGTTLFKRKPASAPRDAGAWRALRAGG